MSIFLHTLLSSKTKCELNKTKNLQKLCPLFLTNNYFLQSFQPSLSSSSLKIHILNPKEYQKILKIPKKPKKFYKIQ